MPNSRYISLLLKSLVFTFPFLTSIESSFGQNEKFKALFIYNFTNFIEWPATNEAEFKITVLGNSDLVTELNTISKQKKVGQKSIQVSPIKCGAELSDCQIVYISKSCNSELPKLIARAKINHI